SHPARVRPCSSDSSSMLSFNPLGDQPHRLLRRAGEVEEGHVLFAHHEILSERLDDPLPEVAEQHEWARLDDLRLELVPDERQLGYGACAAAQGDETGGALDQILEPLVEVCACDLLRQVTIR